MSGGCSPLALYMFRDPVNPSINLRSSKSPASLFLNPNKCIFKKKKSEVREADVVEFFLKKVSVHCWGLDFECWDCREQQLIRGNELKKK